MAACLHVLGASINTTTATSTNTPPLAAAAGGWGRSAAPLQVVVCVPDCCMYGEWCVLSFGFHPIWTVLLASAGASSRCYCWMERCCHPRASWQSGSAAARAAAGDPWGRHACIGGVGRVIGPG
jgi:hypothetical protein